ncbi:MAG: dethiobiotin synthase [Gammaproteobacteria bacterium]|nr:dethiobiotin synthase [Gammaproteobacteria bacterium]
MSALALFVTGTDTGVGKTRVAAGLCRAYGSRGLRVAAMKPVASGSVRGRWGLRNDDALELRRAMTVRAAYTEINPFAFEPPIAPHIAAAEAGTDIDFARLGAAYRRLSARSDVVVVEGAGGWLAPLDAARGFADLAAAWALDVVIVVGLRLGCLNHALLTAESVERRGLRIAGWVGNAIDPGFERRRENLATLRARLPAPCLGLLPYAPTADWHAITAGLSRRLLLPPGLDRRRRSRV